MNDRSKKKFPHQRRPVPVPKLPRPLRDASGPIRPKPVSEIPDTPPTHWGDVAKWYDDLVGEAGSEYHREVVLPGAIRLLKAKPNDHVLDIACGQGVLCRTLWRQGIQTTGIDAAAELIRHAKDRNAQLMNKSAVGSAQSAVEAKKREARSEEREEGKKVPGTFSVSESAIGNPQSAISPLPTAHCPLPTYFTADARDLSFLPAEHFSAAACLLAIQNLNPIAPVFSTIARLLKPLGRFVIVMTHPCFRSPKESSWGWDEKLKVQYRRLDRYLLPRKVPIVTHPGKGGDYTWTFHKPIEAYVKALRNTGLLIDALEEWPSHKTSTSGPRAPAENVARNEIPMFLALRAVKIPGVIPEEENQVQDSAQGD